MGRNEGVNGNVSGIIICAGDTDKAGKMSWLIQKVQQDGQRIFEQKQTR